MEPAAGSERRSSPGPAVPAPPRGHAPSAAAAPSPGPLSSSAREQPQPAEERQLRISESGQFGDGLEDRGESALSRAGPFSLSGGRGEEPPLAGWRGARSRDLPARAPGAEGCSPHLPLPALLPRNPRTGLPSARQPKAQPL